ncbi:hypothetical protein SASPL_128077 [Salvia splendens]|uniref:Uncharacterized protein n=1 Tax=Salvia splendens TaxID=180675 RepID=A0A8X8XD36_SALSN|nr:hypothetical protein SASPL_128077 [Salvia splendens]
MAQKKKELLSSAPWRMGPQEDDKFKDAKLKVTSQPGATPKMHVPGKKTFGSKNDTVGEDSLTEIDPELRYSNFQVCVLGISNDSLVLLQFLQNVFSIDTIVKPLPPTMAYNVSHNLSFFTRIFTQFFDPDGIADAQKSLGLGQGEEARKGGRCCHFSETSTTIHKISLSQRSLILQDLRVFCVDMLAPVKPNTFIPFGSGVHSCPGNELAKLEILLKFLQWETSNKETPPFSVASDQEMEAAHSYREL